MVTKTQHAVRENPTLNEIHRSTIKAHHAKAGYDYPTIQLPLALSALIGLSTRIYQTVHDGALSFFVVVSSASENNLNKHENISSSAESSAFTRRRSGVQIASSPSVFTFVNAIAFV
jgi:hypothetical protein